MANYEGISEVTIIGAGTMGEAFIAALIRSGMKPSVITIVVRREEHGAELAERYGVTVKGLAEAVTTSDVIILGVKPQGLADLLPQIQPHLKGDSLVISLLAGKTIAGISEGLAGHTAIARVMPNTPTLIGKGMAGYSLSSGVTAAQKKFVDQLLDATGKSIEIPEELQNALTGTSGSGPAYFFRFVEVTIQTIVGAAALLDQSGETPTHLREKVTSLKGATAEALAVFDEAGITEIVAKAMAASARRSEELAQ